MGTSDENEKRYMEQRAMAHPAHHGRQLAKQTQELEKQTEGIDDLKEYAESSDRRSKHALRVAVIAVLIALVALFSDGLRWLVTMLLGVFTNTQ